MKDNLFTIKSNISSIFGKMIVFFSFIFLVLLPFHLVIKSTIPDPFGTYWKEILVVIMLILSILILIIDRIKITIFKNQLLLAILLYTGIIIIRLFLDGLTIVQWWGFYISIMYLPFFFVLLIVLNKYPNLIHLYFLWIVFAMSLVALGGVVEFIINKALWPSVELTLRQGFPDMYIYATKIRRIYFVFDSPTTLANTLAIVLPMVIYLFITEEGKYKKVIFGFSIALIISAIIFTFSRGIWVALIITISLFVAYLIYKKGSKKVIITFIGTFLISIIIFFLILTNVVNKRFGHDFYTFELITKNYKTLILDNAFSLFHYEWIDQEAIFQEWLIYDPIENQSDSREVLYMHPVSGEIQSEFVTNITLPERPLLKFSIALSPEIWDPTLGDGVTFKIFIEDQDNPNQSKFVFNRYINPKLNPNERKWRNYIVDLSEWSTENVRLHLITNSGPNHDISYDWAGWADLEIGRENAISKNITDAKQSNPIITYIRSIINWVEDETNRDRLWAWNSGISAWLEKPIFGVGLGSTGVAALNTIPEKAFVTESQLLKSLIELGIPGLLLFIFMWFSIFQAIYILLNSNIKNSKKDQVLALTASLVIIFIEGLVYQNLEVKQVNAYFWFIIGVLLYLFSSRFTDIQTDLNEK